MRISHQYKFIFLATPRTGSTSIRKILDDYSDIKSVHITEINEDFPFYHHISARELKDIFNQRGWNWWDYRKFCIVRNPFDRVVSLFHHKEKLNSESFQKKLKESQGVEFYKKFLMYSKQKIRSFSQNKFENYVMQINPHRNRLATSINEFTCDSNGSSLVDDILMFETLEVELPSYLKNIGLVEQLSQLPHLNKSRRKSYRKYYNQTTKNRVKNLYKYEIERFGYSF